MLNAKDLNWGGKTGLFWAGFCGLALVWAFFRLPEMKVTWGKRNGWMLTDLRDDRISIWTYYLPIGSRPVISRVRLYCQSPR